jgi:hypothetical protein
MKLNKMKTIKNIILGVVAWVFIAGCNDGIDAIKHVKPGPDETAPIVSVTYPVEGTEIKVVEILTSINIKFEVTDDIEIKNVEVKMDGSDVAEFTEFLDYRRSVKDVLYEGLATGTHVLTIIATDIENKVTTVNINFEKAPPYSPIFDGEIFYMPFDGIYTELVSITNPTQVGSPAFAGQGKRGGNAYKGATDSYLTFPTTGLLGTEFSASFWTKINGTPDRAGLLVIGPPDLANPTAQNNRNSGFRLFRENVGGKQRFKLNVGNGTTDSWFDGGAAADVAPNTDEWVNIAFTISATKAVVYINGQVVSQGNLTGGVSWADCDILSIMSGAPRFSGWDHKSDLSYMDELRLFDKSLSQEEILQIIDNEYVPKFDGEEFYMPFNTNFGDLVSGGNATEVGTPGFAGESYAGADAYAGAADSYLTFPTDGLKSNEFSAAFWMKIDATPDRAGILVMGPPDPNLPATPNNRNNGFRFFRENAGGKQRFKLNVGNGTADSWFDGGAAADVDPTIDQWVHLAFTISDTECVVYINGEVVSQGAFPGVDWTGCDILSIMSGAPRFTEWGHHSDEGYMDELRLFSKALTQDEVQDVMND